MVRCGTAAAGLSEAVRMNENNVSSERWAFARVYLLHWFFFLGFGAGNPFFSLYFKKTLRLASGEPAVRLIGTIFFVQAIVGIAALPLAGFLADRFRLERRILAFCAFLVAAAAGLMLVPGVVPGTMALETAYAFILLGAVVNGVFERPVIPLIDSEVLRTLRARYGHGESYGTVRWIGSFGWAVSASIVGWVLSATDQVSISVLCYGAGFLVLALVALGGVRPDVGRVALPWRHLRQDRVYHRLLVFSFIQWFGLSGSFMFTGYFMDDAQTGYLVIGLAMGLAALPEIPIMLRSRRLVNGMGSRRMIALGTGIESAKLFSFVLVALFGKPWMFIAVNILHGMGFSLLYTGMVTLADQRAHQHLRATYQNLFHLSWTLGGAFGGLFASFIIKALGSTWLMGIDGVILAAAAVYVLRAVKTDR
jgi:PPP family 3-phenylpropionic acid transporter